jgi:hypothetical protein
LLGVQELQRLGVQGALGEHDPFMQDGFKSHTELQGVHTLGLHPTGKQVEGKHPEGRPPLGMQVGTQGTLLGTQGTLLGTQGTHTSQGKQIPHANPCVTAPIAPFSRALLKQPVVARVIPPLINGISSGLPVATAATSARV